MDKLNRYDIEQLPDGRWAIARFGNLLACGSRDEARTLADRLNRAADRYDKERKGK